MSHPLCKYLAFLKTVETGSFTQAARQLHYAQSSVSKMVADLEAEWGVTLFERGKSGAVLTSQGTELVPLVRRVLAEHRMLEGRLAQLHDLTCGTVRIGTFASPAIHWLPPIFSRLQRDYPGIGYEMLLGDYEEVERWIEEGRVDCGFLRLPTLPGFDVLPLRQDEYKVVLPVGHPLAEKAAVAIEDLNGLPFLLLEHGGKTEVSLLLEQSHVHPDIRFTTWEDFAVMAMVEQGLGVGILPEMILRRIPYRIEVRPLQTPYYRSIGLAVKDRRHLSPAVRKFLEYLPFREETTEPEAARFS